MKETLALIALLITLVAVPGSVAWYELVYRPNLYSPTVKVFDITAVGAGSGAYTLDDVSGLTYWWKRYKPMTLILTTGDEVILNVHSGDVVHQFYIPTLNVGPADVVPGKVTTLRFTAGAPGVYQYFCTTMCGKCHCYMTGWVVISDGVKSVDAPAPILCPICFVEFDRPEEGDLIDLGDYLYQEMTCNACHGQGGRGGVHNPNYAKTYVPDHLTTASKIFLRTEEDAEAFNQTLLKYGGVEELEEPPDISLIPLVMDRYMALKEIIRNGSEPEKQDPQGPSPPLWMPAWKYMLTDHEIDALISYFIYLYPWEEAEEESIEADETT
ncbi:hypothetical protein DSLASN_43920 [Desulfoluna limicola]|uniref:Cytochrome c domain-containing protein n=1 Tax=Desulfoluna limicola TaxID=2810562 RepID=A0ABM7PNX9_9BACT|nr:c-type cytochrome [Desulfoluna limicola]BCS98760.1 hypothetical protein DSLASN_43920 [Desulfoluna limicola]